MIPTEIKPDPVLNL